MKYPKILVIRTCMICILTYFCCFLCVSAAGNEEYVVVKDNVEIWSNLDDLRQQFQEEVVSVDDVEVFTAHTLSEEELGSLFGTVPRYMQIGSFYLNKLNGLNFFKSPSSLSVVEIGDKYIIARPTWTSLEQEISDMLAGYQGDWSVYLKDLTTGQTMEINEHSMQSASLIKLFIAGAIYDQIDRGNLSESSTVMSALDAMITVSDNESANVLVRQLCDESGDFQTGLAVVNDFIERRGFTNTEQINGISDPSLWVSDGRINITSTADCGRLLEMIYDRNLVSHYNSYRFENLLNRQQVNYKIPAGLPEGVHISHKTGEVSDTENDAAIIYTPYGDYIFCIMSEHLTDTNSAIDHIRSVTSVVYDYFTDYVYPGELTDYTLVEYLPEEPYIIYPREDVVVEWADLESVDTQ